VNTGYIVNKLEKAGRFMLIYTVRAGDSVYGIARAHGVTPEAIVQANGLREPYVDQLVIGQALIVPTKATSYSVQAGDTLAGIAERFGLTLEALRRANPQIRDPNRIHTGQTIRLPRLDFGSIVVNGYARPSARENALDEALPRLSMISVFSCYVTAQGGLIPMQGDQPVIDRAKTAGVRPIMVITNLDPGGGFNTQVAREFLNNPAAHTRLLESCVALMKEKGYTGLDIDFEMVPRDAREGLHSFLAQARAFMHAEGFLLTSAIESMVRDDQPGLIFEGFDYAVQGKYNDYVTIMTYDWGHLTGPPMAVSPINEVRRVIEFAVTRIPREKILMGIPAYGYAWKIPWEAGTRATVIQAQGGPIIAARNGANIEYNNLWQTPWFRYTEPNGQQREAWFEDARSLLAKFELVHEFGLGGVSYWTVNNPFMQNWTLIDELWKVKKV